MNLLNSGRKGMIWKIWVWTLVCAKFWDSELERLSILSRNQLEGTLGRPFKPGAIFCHFLIWINRPHPTHHSTMGMWEGVASAFLSFSGNGRAGGGQLSGQCCKGLGLSNSPVSGKSYIEGRYNPQKPSLRQRTQTSLTDRRLYLGIWTESCWVEKRRENLSKFSGVFNFFAFLSFPAWSHSLSVCLSLNEHPPTISIQMVSSLQDSPQPARGLHQQNCQLWCWLGRGRVIGRIREDIPGKGTSTQWKRLDDGDAPGKHVLGIFCKEGKRKHRSTGHESTC